MKVAIGIWCAAGGALLADIHGKALLQLTADRAHGYGTEMRLLIPWTPELDHLEHEVKSWRPLYPCMRTHPAKAIAMRDLVASLDAEVGLLIDGACAWIDTAEILLAARRLSGNWDSYETERISGRKAVDWLAAASTDEWPDKMDAEALRNFYTSATLKAEARKIKARRRPTGSAERES